MTRTRRRRNARRRTLTLLLALAGAALAAPRPADAQRGWFPRQQRFRPPIADLHEVRLAAGIAWTDLFDLDEPPRERPPFLFPDPGDMDRDLQGIVALGGTLPLWDSSADPDRGIIIGIQAGVFARFRIEEPSRDYAASDWIVALPITWNAGRLAGRARVLHRSAHLGDEIIFGTGAYRIEYGHEALDLLLGYHLTPAARAYAGGTWIFRSNTENEPLLQWVRTTVRDDAALQAGIDGEWRPRRNPRLSLLAGLDWQAAQRTGWRSQLSAAAGIGTRGPGGGVRFLLRFFHGPSTVGEFFLTDESYWALEASVAR